MKSIVMTLGIAIVVGTALSGCVDDTDLIDTAEVGSTDEPLVSFDPTAGPADVSIESISTGGSGCPDQSTLSSVISSDRTSFLVIFDEMTLSNPPSPANKTIQCVAGVRLHIPDGWQFSITTIDTRGYAYLSEGTHVRQSSSYFFAGVPLSTQFQSMLDGPHDGQYSFTDEIPSRSVTWSPCGGAVAFAINTSIRLSSVENPSGLAHFNTETLDGKLKKIVHWQWRRC